ncbi:hypothetical protein A2Z53_00125 [Candidatus Giovannonibacteria bacterium RIFCSPHIGHO2_02_42_15]|uniref:LysM domain-containing protein n=2 Tax=Candidatus Giovannoniibacteriota TaxID=1752738 RepID=A0A1F5VK43_9BACT|nr:MAG: hypothetical protein UU07_C0040G0009 [Parcubacteria group bacterium GW2011_GWF1_40_5]KKS48550.1 MAG: hypothetical protein UV11_C0007G0006 [Candidatus Giovannonibacteria bacterium GW2011_GWF2_42_19]OGF63710.1 MAG: hypothetical protein A2Z53_00125 [Candidatus Giovannonibacteria bacterium RIFCSPHIGHO2_02_42_15]HBB49858.1 hypothetical protein [Candidatus Nomurabacteria bacterium]
MKNCKFFANLLVLLLLTLTAGTTALADEITVAKGDTRWGIAKKVSLNPLAHKEYNVRSPKGEVRQNPDLIFPGDIVTIPEHLVATKKAPEPKREKISDSSEKKQTLSAQTMFAPNTAQKKAEATKTKGAQKTFLQELHVRDNEYPLIAILFAGMLLTCLGFVSPLPHRPPRAQNQHEPENNIFFIGWPHWIERYSATRFRLKRFRKKLTEEIKHEQINAPPINYQTLRQRIDNFRTHHIASFESMEKPLPNEGKIMISRYRRWIIQRGIDIWIAPTKAGKLPSLARYRHNILQRENRILQDNVAAGFIRYRYPQEKWRLINFQFKKGVLFSYKFTEKKGMEK